MSADKPHTGLKRYSAHILAAVVLAALGFVIYSNTLKAPFVFDDFDFIVNNNSLHSPAGISAVWESNDKLRFLAFLSFSLNYRLGALDPSGYHLFNLFIHILCAFAAWWLLRLTFCTPALRDSGLRRYSKEIALSSALIFLSHPLQTEAVSYVYQRSCLLAALFYLLSLCFFAKSGVLADAGAKGRKIYPYYLLSLAAALSAMFSKQSAGTLPLAIIAYELFFFRFKSGAAFKRLIPFILIIIVVPFGVMWSYHTFSPASVMAILEKEAGISGRNYLLTQINVLVTYLRLLVFPLRQNLDYSYPISTTIFEPGTFFNLTMLSALFTAGGLLYRRHRLASFSVFWFFIVLLAESSFLPLQDVIFEHRMYLAMFGFAAFLSCAVFYAFSGKSAVKPGAILLAVAVCFSFLSYKRNLVWQSNLSLWNDAAAKSPDKPRPYINRAFLFINSAEHEKAVKDLDKALMLYYRQLGYEDGDYDYTADYAGMLSRPGGYLEAYNFIAVKYAQIGVGRAARALLEKILELDPLNIQAYVNLVSAYGEAGKFTKAIAFGERGLSIDPDYGQLRYNLGVVFFMQKDYTSAYYQISRALALGYPVPQQLMAEIEDGLGAHSAR